MEIKRLTAAASHWCTESRANGTGRCRQQNEVAKTSEMGLSVTIAKVQHYVPQFLLRNFGNGKKDHLWVYDKTSGRRFSTNAKNVASESRFYDFEFQGGQISLEPWLSNLEAQAKSVIQSILDADSLAHLTDEQRYILASFFSVQMTRTRTFREEWNAFPRLLREHLERNGDTVEPGSQVEQLLADFPENDSKEQTARIIYTAPETYAAHFLAKDWVVAATKGSVPLSDNPLTRQNLIDRPHRGNLGLLTPGIEIYFPLTPTRAIAMFCVELTGIVHSTANDLRGTGSLAGMREPHAALAMSDALRSEGVAHFTAENVENFNSLQISWSERYVFSSTDDFALADSMLADHPVLRSGPRTKVTQS